VYFLLNLVNSNNNKHITQTWKKLAILKFYSQDKALKEIEIKLNTEMRLLDEYNENEELNLRDKQEKEMQEANLKQIKLDIIVNRHIIELEKFKNDSCHNKLELVETYRDVYLKAIDQAFNDFVETVDPSMFIYNSENKLIQIKANKHITNEGDSKKTQVDTLKPSFFHQQKITLGLFNKHKLHVYYYTSKDYLDCDIKNINTGAMDTEDITINEIYQADSVYGESLNAFLNIFKYDNCVHHMVEGLESLSQTETIFENFTKTFMKLEKFFSKGVKPFENDIFTTKHSNSKCFDIILNAFNSCENCDQESLEKGKFKLTLSFKECVGFCE
jgi:hypothetical protein